MFDYLLFKNPTLTELKPIAQAVYTQPNLRIEMERSTWPPSEWQGTVILPNTHGRRVDLAWTSTTDGVLTSLELWTQSPLPEDRHHSPFNADTDPFKQPCRWVNPDFKKALKKAYKDKGANFNISADNTPFINTSLHGVHQVLSAILSNENDFWTHYPKNIKLKKPKKSPT